MLPLNNIYTEEFYIIWLKKSLNYNEIKKLAAYNP